MGPEPVPDEEDSVSPLFKLLFRDINSLAEKISVFRFLITSSTIARKLQGEVCWTLTSKAK